MGFELGDVGGDALHLFGDGDALWAVGGALVAGDAVVGLADAGDGAVVADEEGAAGGAVVGRLG